MGAVAFATVVTWLRAYRIGAIWRHLAAPRDEPGDAHDHGAPGPVPPPDRRHRPASLASPSTAPTIGRMAILP